MDFFHCIRCAHWPLFQPENRLRYFFSSCGRLFCENCLIAINQKCTCGSEGCKFVEIKQQVSKEVKAFFTDPMALFQDALKKPLHILQFQSSMQKNCIRIVGKLIESTKGLKNEISSLKGQIGTLKLENEHLRQQNENLRQQMEILKSKFNGVSQMNTSSSLLGNSPSGQMNSSNDPLNLFREMTERPNAQVPPNAHLQQQQRSGPPTPAGNRASSFQASVGFVAPSPQSVTSHHSKNQLFSQMTGFSQPFSVARSNNPSPASFGTPLSSISQLSGGAQSPFQRRNDQSSSMLINSGSGNGRTPDIINRLRNLKCRATPNGSPHGFRP